MNTTPKSTHLDQDQVQTLSAALGEEANILNSKLIAAGIEFEKPPVFQSDDVFGYLDDVTAFNRGARLALGEVREKGKETATARTLRLIKEGQSTSATGTLSWTQKCLVARGLSPNTPLDQVRTELAKLGK